MEQEKRVLVIGGGIAGLCSSIYLQMNGFQVQILEAHKVAGGLCTSWRRSGYTFDGCLHWLLGSSERTPIHRVWSELIDIKALKFVDHDHVLDLEVGVPDANGDTMFHFYADIDRQEQYLLRAAPEDEKLIRRMMAGARKLDTKVFPPVPVGQEVKRWRDRLASLRILPLLPTLIGFGKTTALKFAAKAKTPFFKAALERMYGKHDAALLILLLQQSFYSNRVAGYPIGGSQAFIQPFVERFKELGGELRTGMRVSEVLVEEGTAVGVRCEDGSVERADVVVSAADGHWTLYQALGGRYLTPKLKALYEGHLMPTYPSLVYLSLGLRRQVKLPCHLVRYRLDQPWTLPDGSVVDDVPIHVYDYDPTLAPEGCTTLTVMLESRALDYWQRLRDEDRQAYQEAKQSVAERVIDLLEERIGGVRDAVQVVDVATPATFHRYTGNWQGSYEGWLPLGNVLKIPKIPKELPGLRNFHMVGQWVEPGGGLPPGALHGRMLAQTLCARHGRAFRVVP